MCGAGVWKKGQGTKETRYFVGRLGLENTIASRRLRVVLEFVILQQ
jgi:hypothetical protein